MIPSGGSLVGVTHWTIQDVAVTLGAFVVVVSAVFGVVARLVIRWLKREIVDTVAPLLSEINRTLADTNERIARIEGAAAFSDSEGLTVHPVLRRRRPRVQR